MIEYILLTLFLDFSMYDNIAFIAEDASVEQLIKLFTDPKYYFRLHRVAVIAYYFLISFYF